MRNAAMPVGEGGFEKVGPMSRHLNEKSYLRGDNSAVTFEAEAFLELLLYRYNIHGLQNMNRGGQSEPHLLQSQHDELAQISACYTICTLL